MIWDEHQFGLLRAQLEAAKAFARGDDGAEVDSAEVTFGGEVWTVADKGHQPKGGGVRYEWHLKRGGVVVCISKHLTPPGKMQPLPNATIDMGSAALMVAGGAYALWQQLLLAFKLEGAKVSWNKVSRMDVCVDLPGVHVEELTAVYRSRQFVSRATDHEEFEGRIYASGHHTTGFRVGCGILLRAYDKLREVRHDETKLEIMRLYRWGGVIPSAATRVEFELPREALKSCEIDSIDDWQNRRCGVASYLTGEWIRFYGAKIDKRQTKRGEILPLWREVSKRFQAACSSGVTTCKRTFTRSCEPKALMRQAAGCILSAVAGSMERAMHVGEVIAQAKRKLGELLENLGPEAVCGKLADKRAELVGRYPLSGLPPLPRRGLYRPGTWTVDAWPGAVQT